MDDPDLSQMDEATAAEHIFWQHRRAKRMWRRFTGKPVRRFRRNLRFAKRRKGKGKGKGKSKTRGFMWTHDDTMVFLKGKGKVIEPIPLGKVLAVGRIRKIVKEIS